MNDATMAPETLFAQWLRHMGFHRRQVAQGGELLGLRPEAAGRRNRGEVEPDTMERLAMSAVRAGLPPWSPENDRQIARLRAVLDLIRESRDA